MQEITGTLTESGASAAIYVEPNETINVLVSVADMEEFEGTVVVERSRDGVNFETAVDVDNTPLIATGVDMDELTGTIFEAVIRNTDTKRNAYRVRAEVGEADGLSYELIEVTGDRMHVLLRDRNGRPVAWVLDDGSVELSGVKLSGEYLKATEDGEVRDVRLSGLNKVNVEEFEEVTSNGDDATSLSVGQYGVYVTSGGSEGAEDITIASADFVGQRKLVVFAVQTHASDVLALNHSGIVGADGAALDALTIDDEGGFVLIEWNGLKWQVIYSGDATITPS